MDFNFREKIIPKVGGTVLQQAMYQWPVWLSKGEIYFYSMTKEKISYETSNTMTHFITPPIFSCGFSPRQ